MIELVIFSFFAGALTVLAPCILPLIPVLLGASTNNSEQKSIKRPIVIIASLITSIIIFTLLLRSTTALLGVPTEIWSIISGTIILLFGINSLFPSLWEQFILFTKLYSLSNKGMAGAQDNPGYKKDIMLGAALGPVFNSCSPTYALIIAVLLPASFASGLLYLSAYSIGLGAVLLLVVIFGQSLISKIKWMSKPSGVFQKAVGVLFIIVGVIIIFGVEKDIQAAILESGIYGPIESIEKSFLNE